MPTNPIQRKTRNSFLLGMLIMLIISLIIGALLYVFVFNEKSAVLGNKNDKTVYVYKLVKNIKSGDHLTADALTREKLLSSEVPLNYINAAEANTLTNDDIAKVDLYQGTILTKSLISKSNEDLSDKSLRVAEFNMLTLPSTLRVGDYIDVRVTFPNGLDYIVISKKRVMSLNQTTIGLYLTEEEILTMNCAIIESYIMTASNIYAIQYAEPGMQEKADQTYPVNKGVYALAQTNPNILNEIKGAMKARYESTGELLRKNYIDPELSSYMNRLTTEKAPYLQDVETQLQKQIENARETYLSGLESL